MLAPNVHPFPHRPTPQQLLSVRVLQHTPAGFLLDTPEPLCAQVAVSCLLEPQTGDTVLVSHGSNASPSFILAVLERPDADQGTLNLPGNHQFVLSPGHLQIESDAISVNARQKIALNSSAVDLTAVTSSMKINHWNGWFDSVEAGAVSIRLIAQTLSSRLGRLIQQATESFRTTKGLDEVRAGRSRVHIEGHQHIEAQHMTQVAKGFVKIDGQKIDLG